MNARVRSMSAGERASRRQRCRSRRSVGRKIKTRFFFFLHNALPPTTITTTTTTTTVSRTLSRVEHFRVKVLSPRRGSSEYTNPESTDEFQKADIHVSIRSLIF